MLPFWMSVIAYIVYWLHMFFERAGWNAASLTFLIITLIFTALSIYLGFWGETKYEEGNVRRTLSTAARWMGILIFIFLVVGQVF
ncbi:hypothetical protein J7J56_01375 [candidate division WOR-3 bacterium]|nr:hypothetical protein [candidate division WOR-3 bacterium]